MFGAPFAQRIVEHAVPCLARRRRQAIGENVRPGADDLTVDALLGQPGPARRGRLDQPRKERPHLEAVIELQGFAARWAGEPDPDVGAARPDRGDELRRYVMGMNVDRHRGCPR
jgi:hypothetical protein